MKQINILKFGAKNYCLFQDPIDIDIKYGLNFVVGPNGVGKTSCLEIPLVCFFGENSKGDRVKYLVNNRAGKDCYLYTDFEIIDEDGTKTSYKCERFGNYKGSNTALLSRNNEEPYKKGHKEVTDEITNLIGPKRLVTNTIIFPQKPTGLFLDLTDSERKDIFRKISNLDDYPVYQKQASEDEKNLNSQLQEMVNQQEVYRQRLEELDETLKDLSNRKEEFEKQKSDEIDGLDKEIEEIRKNIEDMKSEQDKYDYEELKSKYQEINQEVSDLRAELNSIVSDQDKELESLHNNAKSKKSDINEKYANNKAELQDEQYRRLSEIDQSSQESIDVENERKNEVDVRENKLLNDNSEIENNKIPEVENKLDFYRGMLNEEKTYCYECDQEVSPEHVEAEITELENKDQELLDQKKDIDSELEQLKQNRKEILSRIKKIQEDKENQKGEVRSEINQRISELDERANKSKQEVDEATKKYENQIRQKYKDRKVELEKSIETKNNQMSDINEKLSNLDNLKNKIDNNKNRLEYKLDQLENKKKETFDETQITNTKNRIATTKENIDDLNDKKRNIEVELEIVKFWKQGFSNSGIPSMLIDESIPFMNKRIRDYLDIMSGGRYIVSFDTLKETQGGEFRDKISINVYDNETGANSKSLLSGGQSRIVDIATILTLSDLQYEMQGISYNLRIYDEILDSLDNESIGHVSRALRQLSEEKSIFVVSHQHVDELEADQVLRFMS